MKFFKPLFTLIAFSILTYSCSSDDNNTNSGNEQLANEQNQLEEANVPVANLNSDISIDGATKNQGTPPAPNSNINLEISSDKAEAFQSSGFNLKFSTAETTIAGAYLLFKDSDNNTASEYFDIPVSEFTNKSGNTKNNKLRGPLKKSSKTLIDGEYEIDVDFGSSFPPGKFCADLCIYDAQENISQIVTVCVEVEAWGGNAAIVGEWILESSEEDDYKFDLTCDNEETVEVEYSQPVKEDVILNIDSNGDFYTTYYEEYKELDNAASRASCSAIYSDEVKKENTKQTGKWAYNETDKTLTLVSFKYEDFINPQESKDYPNGQLIFEGGDVSIVDGKLVIIETDTENNVTYTDTFTFVRK